MHAYNAVSDRLHRYKLLAFHYIVSRIMSYIANLLGYLRYNSSGQLHIPQNVFLV